MSYTSLLRHRVDIVREEAVLDGPGGDPTYDGLGQPITAARTIATVRCRIEPRPGAQDREVALLSQAGAVLADHVIFMVPRAVPAGIRTADHLVPNPDDGRRFEIHAIHDGGGAGRSMEVLARLTTSDDVPLPPP